MTEESGNASLRTDCEEVSHSRRILVSLAGNHSFREGILFNSLASSLEPRLNFPEETEMDEKEEKSEKKEEAPIAAVENVSGVRKKLLIPAEEALDSARVAAEMVMKDAMETMQRTKQRLMEIFHRNSSSQASPAPDEVTKAPDAVNQDDDNKHSNKGTAIGHLFSEPAMGFAFPSQEWSERIISRL